MKKSLKVLNKYTLNWIMKTMKIWWILILEVEVVLDNKSLTMKLNLKILNMIRQSLLQKISIQIIKVMRIHLLKYQLIILMLNQDFFNQLKVFNLNTLMS